MIKENTKNKGFSLIELMIVISILSILLGIAVVNYRIFLIQFSVNQAADEATIALRSAQQKAITLGMKSGIYIYSKTEYWVFAEPMSTADLIPYHSLLAAVAMPLQGVAPASPSYLPMQPPSNVSSKVKLENARIDWPEVGCAIYCTPETKTAQSGSWKITTVYIYPSIAEGQTVMIFSGGNNLFGIRYKDVFVGYDGKFMAVLHNSPGGPTGYNAETGKYTYGQPTGPYMPGTSPAPNPNATPYYLTNPPPMPGGIGNVPAPYPINYAPPPPGGTGNVPAPPGGQVSNPVAAGPDPFYNKPILSANAHRTDGVGTLVEDSEIYDASGTLIRATFLNPEGSTSVYSYVYVSNGLAPDNPLPPQPQPGSPVDANGNPILPGMTNNPAPPPPPPPISFPLNYAPAPVATPAPLPRISFPINYAPAPATTLNPFNPFMNSPATALGGVFGSATASGYPPDGSGTASGNIAPVPVNTNPFLPFGLGGMMGLGAYPGFTSPAPPPPAPIATPNPFLPFGLGGMMSPLK